MTTAPKKTKTLPKVPVLKGQDPQFSVGQDYVRKVDIHGNYGGSEQGGISPSAFCKAIFLFTGASGGQFGYSDTFGPSGEFEFCGEGQVGPMKFIKGNKAIRDHLKDYRALHLFESLGKGKKQRYLGQFLLKGSRIIQGPDKNGAIRDTIIFDLLPGGMLPSAGLTPVATISPKPAVAPTLAALRAAAIAASKANAGKTTLPVPPSVQQQRSDTVKDYVLMRPNGICECCGKPAPFLRKNNTPYLEAHHIERLSDDGIDHPQNMAAICPACHCEIHFGVNGDAVNSKLASKIKVKW